MQDRDMAGAIFKFTDGIPGADIGRAMQQVDIGAGTLISEVEMTVFPGISGAVVTTSSISGRPPTLRWACCWPPCTVVYTYVNGSDKQNDESVLQGLA